MALIEKKGKDKRLIKNWRPGISLTGANVDAKIALVLANRLEKVLPEIIRSFNENAFVKGKSIFDAIRKIDDVMEYTKEKELSGILVAIDFEKASVDTLKFDFLRRHYTSLILAFILFRGFISNIV